MTISRSVYSTEELLGVIRELEPVPVFWRRWFTGQHLSVSENIEYSQIPGRKRLAPFVLPTIQGKPVYGAEEELRSFKPAYLKPKDAVTPSQMVARAAGFGELGQLRPMSPQERYNATVAAILQEHRNTIERRWEWMCAEALINGKLTIPASAEYPGVVVDFKRASTLTLSTSEGWSSTSSELVEKIEGYLEAMDAAPFGVAATDMILGKTAWNSLRKNMKILALLDTETRGTVTNIDIGIGSPDPFVFKGRLNNSLSVWLYRDQYEVADGTATKYLADDQCLLLAPAASIQGVRCYGAILDEAASLNPLAMFSKMWNEDDPSATVIMTQSAPLMVPLNPNATMLVKT